MDPAKPEGVTPRDLRARFWRAEEAQRDPLDVSGTRAADGRYNPPLAFGALYCGDTSRCFCARRPNRAAARCGSSRGTALALS